MNKTQIIKDACRRYPEIPSRTIAQYIVSQYPGLYNPGESSKKDPIEIVRGRVRYYRGKHGAKDRGTALRSGSGIPADDSIKMPKSWRRHVAPFKMPVGVSLVLPDVHAPFHEERPLESAIKAGQIEKVDNIFLGGDFQDCAAVGFWTQKRRDFMEELNVTLDLMDFIRGEFPGKKIYYKLGNHEERLDQYYRNNAPVLASTVLDSVESLLGVESRGIELIEPTQMVMFGKLPFFHGHELKAINQAVNPARGLFLKTHSYAAIAHCHKPSMHSEPDLHDKDLTTWSFGCLCSLHPEWFPYGNRWRWGFGIISTEKDGNFEVVNRRVLTNGTVV